MAYAPSSVVMGLAIVECTVAGFAASSVFAKPTPAAKCLSAKLKATGKKAAAKLACEAKAATKLNPVDSDCTSKADGAFMKAFTKADQKGGCATPGDVGALDAVVGDFVDQVAAQLSGTTSTTVTTTTTVTTSPAPTTTSPGPTTTTGTTSTTMAGPSTVAVTVGPNGNFVFDPATVTIRVGDTVHWTWGSTGHSVVSGQVINNMNTPDGKFCSPNDTNCATAPASFAGATYDHTFTAAGTYPYYCAPHGVIGMVGTVVVQP